MKSKSGLQLRNSANQRLNAKDAKVLAEDAEENFFATFAGAFAFFAFKSCMHFVLKCVLLTYCWFDALPDGRATAPGVLAKSNYYATSRCISVAFAAAFTFAHAAAESASMGRGDFVSWAAV